MLFRSIGWKSPVRGPVHPSLVDLGEPSGLGWLDGFDELFVRCGLESNGAPEFDEKTGRLKYPLHGRIGNKPAHHVEVSVDGDSGEIKVTGVVEESRFHFLKLRMTATITTKVKAQMVEDPVVKASQVGVETMQGVVQLSGFVPSKDLSVRAEQIARRVDGVRGVKNDLVVR